MPVMLKPSEIKALLFDLGRVVVATDGARAARIWARQAGRPADGLLAPHETIPAVRDAYMGHERGRLTDNAFFAVVRRELGLPGEDASLLEGWNAIIGGEMPGIREVLVRARTRYPLYAFSNTNPAHKAVLLAQHGELLSHFRKLYLSHEIGLRKPDREAFLAVAQDMAYAPCEILFFDDSLANVEGARDVGMQAIHVTGAADVAAAIATLPI
jgi:putative hydrolase of the HAD superfamily